MATRAIATAPGQTPMVAIMSLDEEAALRASQASDAQRGADTRTGLAASAVALTERLAAAERARDVEGVPEADAEARRLRTELDAIKARLDAARSAP